MPAWVYVVAVAAVLFVLWAAVVRGWWRSVRYSWARARHVLEVTAREPVVAPEYGSMILAEERGWRNSAETYGPVMAGLRDRYGTLGDGPDWREQTAADLSPEALEDSGPGDLSSLTPGPDQAPDVRSSGAVAGSIPAIALGGSEFNPHGHPGSTPVSWLADRHDGEGEGRAFHGLNHAHTERLADTADVMDARLLADVAAEMRAQDDDAALYLSRLRSACAQYRLDLQAALA